MTTSFSAWLESREREFAVPEVTRLNQIIAAGPVTRRTLKKAISLPPDLIDSILRALVDTRQVEIISG